MNITTTDFEFNYHGKQNNLHIIDVYNNIIIDDVELIAVYQTGQSYYNNDYNQPCEKLALSQDGGTNPVLILVNSLYASDFDDIEIIQSLLDEIHEKCPLIDTVDKLKHLYDTLNDNLPVLSDFID